MEKLRTNLRALLTGLVLLGFFVVNRALAAPCYATDTGNSCSTSGCHATMTTGRMGVTNEDTTINLGSGSLKTFVAAPGEKVTLSMNVLNGSTKYAVQLKNFEMGGQLVSASNHLVWSAANVASNVWVKWQNLSPVTPPYYTKEVATCNGISWAGTTIPYTFDLQIDASTPPDIYKLTFAVAGQQSGRWDQEENFYLEVLCPYSLAGDVNDDCRVDLLDLAVIAQNWLVDCAYVPADPACVPK